MIVHIADDRLLVHAPAKVNLHLEVLGKRADGYHELETVLVAISLYDTLDFRERPRGTRVPCADAAVGDEDHNLVTRAVRLVREESGIDRGIEITLTKRIPVAAGLAGGSSDAAAALLGLDRWWNLSWDRERLVELGARLGSDVPFFFFTPAAVARGRGERLAACPMPRPLDFVVVSPPAGLATAEVFRGVTVPESPVRCEELLEALAAGNVTEIARRLFNRLEEASCRLSPHVADLKRRAASWDCLGHRMSGSGSSYFALCASNEKALALGRQLSAEGLGRVFVVRSSP